MLTKYFSKKILLHITLELIVALFIILWLYTGINKLMDHEETRVQMGRSPFIEQIAGVTAISVPVGELILAVLLIFRKTRLIGLYCSLLLMTLFTGYIYLMLHYSFDLPCSCGGVLRELSWQEHLYFNAGFTLLSAVGIVLSGSRLYGKTGHRLNPSPSK